MKKTIFILLFFVFILSGSTPVFAGNYTDKFGVGLEAISEVLLGVRLAQRWNTAAIVADLGYLPTDHGGLSMVRMSFRKYKTFLYGFVGAGQWSGATSATFADAGGGIEAHLGALSLSLEVGPVIPLSETIGSENTVAFITSLSLMLWF